MPYDAHHVDKGGIIDTPEFVNMGFGICRQMIFCLVLKNCMRWLAVANFVIVIIRPMPKDVPYGQRQCKARYYQGVSKA